MLAPDQVRLLLENAAERYQDDDNDGALGWVLDLLKATLPDLIEENARLRRALHLSELSRGMPSSVGRD